MNELSCSGCGHRVHYLEKMPRFCEECGSPFDPSVVTNRPSTSSSSNFKRPESASGAEGEQTVPPTGFFMMPGPPTGLIQVAGFEIVRELGTGGMGRVYEARESDSGRFVALKILSSRSEEANDEAVDRFLREGRLAAKVSHPRSTFVYEAGFSEGRPFIAMELMPGKTLQDELRECGKMSVPRAVDATIDILDGLTAAHNLGVIHRDVKPSNCFVDHDGRIKIGDFGLSKSLTVEANLTRTGTFMGTPSFSSPEQVRGEDVDKRTDVYSLGATLFNLLTGQPPFIGDAMSVTAQIISKSPPSLRDLNPEVPKGLEKIIQQALAKSPGDRFADLDSMRSALLPFASQGASLAQMGRRIAGFMLDYAGYNLILFFISAALGMMVAFSGSADVDSGQHVMENMPRLQLWSGIIGWLVGIVYFTIFESIWGWSPGKLLMGLRLVNQVGEKPPFWRCLLRSFIVPGALGIPLIPVFVESFGTAANAKLTIEWTMFSWFINVLPLVLLGLFCLLTMARTEGLLGLHDLISGTRLIHLVRPKSFAKCIDVVLPFRALPEPRQMGRFIAQSMLPETQQGLRVYQGQDEILERKVLIFETNEQEVNPLLGTHVNRSSRNRWLQGGYNDRGRWDAFEYFGGVPFSFVTNRAKGIEWEDIKYAVFDWTRELVASVQDDTLPTNLSFDHLLIDEQGRGRLIELPVNITGFSQRMPLLSSSTDGASALNAAHRVTCDMLDWIQNTLALPDSAVSAFNCFRCQPMDLGAMEGLRDDLDRENRRPSRLTWDARVGVLAVTGGLEWGLYSGLSTFGSWLVLSKIGYFPIWKPIGFWLVVMLALFALGWLTSGGPIFRLLGVEVRRRNGLRSSGWLNGARMVLSWAPLCASAIILPLFLTLGYAEMNKKLAAENSDAQLEAFKLVLKGHEYEFLAMLLFCGLAALLMVAGAIVSVISPQRGVQDFLLGTRLVPR